MDICSAEFRINALGVLSSNSFLMVINVTTEFFFGGVKYFRENANPELSYKRILLSHLTM